MLLISWYNILLADVHVTRTQQSKLAPFIFPVLVVFYIFMVVLGTAVTISAEADISFFNTGELVFYTVIQFLLLTSLFGILFAGCRLQIRLGGQWRRGSNAYYVRLLFYCILYAMVMILLTLGVGLASDYDLSVAGVR